MMMMMGWMDLGRAGKDRQGQIDINCSGLPSVSLSRSPILRWFPYNSS